MKKLIIKEHSRFFKIEKMEFSVFPSETGNIRKYSVVVAGCVPEEHKEGNLLEQQVSEVIKNGITHGNKCDPQKPLNVWYLFEEKKRRFRMIVEDTGRGFQDIEKWNEFYKKRDFYFKKQDTEKILEYISYRTPESTGADGGNSLFAAIEYWNGGIIYNKKRNKVVVIKEWK